MIEWIIGGALAGALTSGSVMSSYLLSAYREKWAKEKELQEIEDNPFTDNETNLSSVKNLDMLKPLSSLESSIHSKPKQSFSDNKNDRIFVEFPSQPQKTCTSKTAYKNESTKAERKRDIDYVDAFINSSKSVIQNDFKVGIELMFYNFSQKNVDVGISSITPIWGYKNDQQFDTHLSNNFFGTNGYHNITVLKMNSLEENIDKYMSYSLKALFKPDDQFCILKGVRIEIYDLSNYDKKVFTIK